MKDQKSALPQYDEFVKDIRPDPLKIDQNTLLSGYIGESSLDDHFRIYFDDELNRFIEVPNEAVIKSEKRSTDSFPLGGCYVWVKSHFSFTYGEPKINNRPKSSFFEGRILSDFTKRKPFSGIGKDDDPPVISQDICAPTTGPTCPPSTICPPPPTQSFCPSTGVSCSDTGMGNALPPSRLACPSWIDACATRGLGCGDGGGGTLPPSRLVCPSWVDACPTMHIGCNYGGTGGGALPPSRLRCPSWIDACPTIHISCNYGGNGGGSLPPSRLKCPSWIDACP